MKAVILAGGEGKRLRPLTNDKPKPLLDVGGKPIIEWQILWMKKYGISSFVVLAGYMKDRLIEYLGTGAKWGVDIDFVVEEEPLGSGGAIRSAREILKNESTFIVSNGDIITNIDLNKLMDPKDALAVVSLVPLRSTYGIVDTDDGKVIAFREKPVLKEYWLNAGIYSMSNKIFEHLPARGSIETDTFPKLASLGLLGSIKFDSNYWASVDNIKDYESTSSDLSKGIVYG